MNEAERRAWLPQWLQHEFFHHLYRTYGQLKLEDSDSSGSIERRGRRQQWNRRCTPRCNPGRRAQKTLDRLTAESMCGK
jgi:hypothetical protein